ncbi:uncharacterized protein PG986_001441 [Apiospora aurea]|uniref:SWIM-type domain-containing protein n=1 Tax=Apiospora aurea TaxID=335848 RepID=A0ABR1QWZ2_9PEZI
MVNYLVSSHRPDLTKAVIIGTAAAEKIVEPYKVIKWQIGSKYKYWHTLGEDNNNNESKDLDRPCFCGQYFVHWACEHWIKLPVRCGKSVSPTTGNPVICKRRGKATQEVVMDHISCVEECDDCTAFIKDANEAFDELEREARCVKREPSPS